jgi:hypothetical protein
MNKKILLGLIAGTIFAIVVVFFSLSKSSKNQIRSPISQNLKTKVTVAPKQKLKEYKDRAGFKFSYPDNLKLETKETEAQKIYSLIELTSSKNQAKIEIKVEDSKLTKIDDWFTSNKESTKPGQIKKIKLADIEGRQFNQKNKLLTIALDQGVLFTFTLTPDKDKKFWTDVNNKIIQTFAFELSETTTGGNTSTTSESSEEDVIFEGEEIIE